MSNTIAVEDSGLSADSVALNNKITEIAENFEKFKTIANGMDIDGDLKGSLTQKITDIENNFPLIISNLEQYVNDLIIIRNNYKSSSDSIKVSELNITDNKGGEIINVREF